MYVRMTFATVAIFILSISQVHAANGDSVTRDICYPNLPPPILSVSHAELYSVSGQLFSRFNFSVQNWAEFPDELFVASPNLPPCGANPDSARTWVDVLAQSGDRLNGFCGLSSAEGLNATWFSIDAVAQPPSNVYITLHDRLCDVVYTSNLASTAVDADGDGLLDLQDNCSLAANPDQRDTNGDQIGNACDADLDNNCSVDFVDLGLFKSVFFTADADADLNGDGFVNFADLAIVKQGFFQAPGPSGIINVCIQ